MHILALDVGTSSVKAAVLDVETTEPVSGIAREGYELDHPTPEAAEIPTERLWNAIAAAARQAVGELPGAGNSVEGVGMAVLTPALVLLDKADKPISPIWIHLDRRSRPVARHVWQAKGKEFLETTGNRPLPGGITVMSYRQQINDDPHLTQRIGRYLHANGWLGLKMTGEAAFDPGNASFTGLFATVKDQQWSQKWCDYFEVDPAWLPPVRDGNTTLGSLRPGPADDLGVPAGLPVKLGVPDTSSAILLVNMTEDDLMHVVGTTQVVATLVNNPQPNERLLTRLLGAGGKFLQVAHNPVGGVALDWIRRLCFRDQDEDDFYEKTVPQAVQHETRVSFDPPYLGGDRVQIEAVYAGYRDLSLTTQRLDLLAALLRAMLTEHRNALHILKKGTPFQRLFLTGGAADIVRKLIPEYEKTEVHQFEEGSLKGIARLFS